MNNLQAVTNEVATLYFFREMPLSEVVSRHSAWGASFSPGPDFTRVRCSVQLHAGMGKEKRHVTFLARLTSDHCFPSVHPTYRRTIPSIPELQATTVLNPRRNRRRPLSEAISITMAAAPITGVRIPRLNGSEWTGGILAKEALELGNCCMLTGWK